MEVQPQSDTSAILRTTDELIAGVRASRNQCEQEVSSLVNDLREGRTKLASMEQTAASMEQAVRSVSLLSRSLQSESERIGPLVLAALSRRARRQPGWKAKIKALAVPVLEPHKMYSPAEVAVIMGVSYDTAIRRMEEMRGVMDFGTKETRFKRPKRKLRVSGRDLMDYFRKHTLDESN